MNSRSSFKNHTQFQTLTLTPNQRANPNNPPHTKDQHFESEEQPSNSQHNAFQTGFVRSEMVTWSDIQTFILSKNIICSPAHSL